MITEQKINVGTRIGSMFLDHIAMTFVAMMFFIPQMVSEFSNAFDVTHDLASSGMFGEISYFGLIGFALYFCKDSINGRSIAKRALKLQVVENSSGRVASPFRCLIRNIFCILWPIEIIVTFVSPSRRIGDFVAGTRVVPYNPEIKQNEIKYLQIGLSIIIAFTLMVLLKIQFEGFNLNNKNNDVTYIENSFNENASKDVETLLTDSLGAYLTPEVVVYDHIKENADLKYVSLILRLNKNYFENAENFEKIRYATLQLLLTKFPVETFVGQIKFVYQHSGSSQTRTLTLDWRNKE